MLIKHIIRLYILRLFTWTGRRCCTRLHLELVVREEQRIDKLVCKLRKIEVSDSFLFLLSFINFFLFISKVCRSVHEMRQRSFDCFSLLVSLVLIGSKSLLDKSINPLRLNRDRLLQALIVLREYIRISLCGFLFNKFLSLAYFHTEFRFLFFLGNF